MKKYLCATTLLTLMACNETPTPATSTAINTRSNDNASINQTLPEEVESTLILLAEYRSNAEKLITLIEGKGADADIEKQSASLVAASKPNGLLKIDPSSEKLLYWSFRPPNELPAACGVTR